jgi:hypothetical protein
MLSEKRCRSNQSVGRDKDENLGGGGMNPHLYKKRKGGLPSILLACLVLVSAFAGAQVDVRSFEGMSASKVSSAGLDVDPNGAVGTKHYLEWVNAAFQGYDKKTFASVYASPVSGDAPFIRNGLKQCSGGLAHLL